MKNLFNRLFSKSKTVVVTPKPVVFEVGDRVKFINDYSYQGKLYYRKSFHYIITSIEYGTYIEKHKFSTVGIYLNSDEMREYCIKINVFKYGK